MSERRRLLQALGALALLPAARSRAQVGAAPGCDAATPLPPRFQLDYVAQAARGMLTLDGENELRFDVTPDGARSRYAARSITRSVLFSAEQRSSGELRFESGRVLLIPQEYVERSGRREPRRTRIDWQTQQVSFSANAEGGAPTQPRLQDRLTLLLQVGQVLRARAADAGGELALPVAGARHITTYRLALRGGESLDLPIGRLETVKLERPLTRDDDGLEIWVAPQLCWLPVRIRFTDDRGQVIQNQLRAARFD